jgi:hypothetical protein
VAHNDGVLPSNATPRFWLWPNLLSLDAPLVALVWQVLFARCFHVGVPMLPAVLLVLAVWLIYAADRAFDAWTMTAVRPRHEFYRRNWRAVLPLWAVVFAATGWLAWTRLAPAMFIRGTVLLGGVALYFAAVHLLPARMRTVWPKEAAVAVLFALGATVAAWANVHSVDDLLSIVLFSCLCWINCVAIEQWERRDNSRWPIGAAAICVAAAAIILLHQHRPILGGAETASAIVFVVLDRGRNRLSADALRVMADVALLTPILFLPIAGML